VARQLERLWARTRSKLRQVLWWIWPSFPTSWSDVPVRLRPAASEIARLTAAAVLAYLVADRLSPGILDLTAPLTAVLIVQASTVGTVQMSLVRVAAVLTGVLVAVGLASLMGLSWWSLGLVIAASLVLAKVLRLGEQSLETPISAMLILAVSSPDLAAEVRVVNTLVGTAAGIVFSLLVPVSIPNVRATEAVRRVARSQAALLDEAALTLADRTPHPEEVEAWLQWIEEIERDLAAASAAVQALEESRRFNPRALAAAKVHPGLEATIEQLDRCLAAELSILLGIGKGDGRNEELERSFAPELRRAFSVVLNQLADAVRCFGDLVSAEFGGGTVDQIDELSARTVDLISETQAVLTELSLLDVDPREQPGLWMLQGSVLAAVEQVLAQLDPRQRQRSIEAWLDRYDLPRIPGVPSLLQSSRQRRLWRGPI
jgi:uncharacterized membrane protein YccC